MSSSTRVPADIQRIHGATATSTWNIPLAAILVLLLMVTLIGLISSQVIIIISGLLSRSMLSHRSHHCHTDFSNVRIPLHWWSVEKGPLPLGVSGKKGPPTWVVSEGPPYIAPMHHWCHTVVFTKSGWRWI